MARLTSFALALFLVLPAAASDRIIVSRSHLDTALGDALEEMARLQGLAQGKKACRDVARDLTRLRNSLRALQDELRRAEVLPDTVSLNVATHETGVSITAGGAGMQAGLNIQGGAHPAPGAGVTVQDDGYGGVDVRAHAAAPLPEPAPAPEPMYEAPPAAGLGSADFDELVEAVEDESFADGKLRVLSEAAGYGWFTTNQVRRLLDAFDFGNDKLKALEILAPRIVDPQNKFRIYKAFDFDSDKAKAKRILR